MTKQQTIDISQISSEQLEALLAEKKAAEVAERNEKRRNYECERNALVDALGGEALNVEYQLKELKAFAFANLSEFRNTMLEYGDLKRGEKNKGSFSIQNETFRIEFSNHLIKAFDERAELAESKLREFMNGFLKKKAHKDVIAIISALLERNTKSGAYDINLINRLYAMKDKFNEPCWIEAIERFQEAYSPAGTTQYVRFFRKNAAGGWEPIAMNIASIKLPELEAAEG